MNSVPIEPVHKIVNYLKDNIISHYPEKILNPCAKGGSWGSAMKSIYTESIVYGIESSESFNKPSMYDFWQTGSYLDGNLANKKFDIIIASPPLSNAEAFLNRALTDIAVSGTIIFMLPIGFMGSIGRFKRIFSKKDFRPNEVVILSRRIDFTGEGSPHTDNALFIWDWRAGGVQKKADISWFDWKG